MSTPKHILVATDFSECSQRAVDVAVELTQALRAELEMVHVWQVTPITMMGLECGAADLSRAVEATAREQLAAEVARVRRTFPSCTGFLCTGVAWDGILCTATAHAADLIVMGTHGRSGLSRAMVGSVAEHVVRESTVPVVSVRFALPRLRPTTCIEGEHEHATAPGSPHQ